MLETLFDFSFDESLRLISRYVLARQRSKRFGLQMVNRAIVVNT